MKTQSHLKKKDRDIEVKEERAGCSCWHFAIFQFQVKTCTSIFRPSITVLCNFSRARSASALVSKVTKPKPCVQRGDIHANHQRREGGRTKRRARKGEKGEHKRTSAAREPDLRLWGDGRGEKLHKKIIFLFFF